MGGGGGQASSRRRTAGQNWGVDARQSDWELALTLALSAFHYLPSASKGPAPKWGKRGGGRGSLHGAEANKMRVGGQWEKLGQ